MLFRSLYIVSFCCLEWQESSNHYQHILMMGLLMLLYSRPNDLEYIFGKQENDNTIIILGNLFREIITAYWTEAKCIVDYLIVKFACLVDICLSIGMYILMLRMIVWCCCCWFFCRKRRTDAAAFHPHNANIVSISQAYKTLIPLFGATAGVVFLVTLLSSGIASSVTGTLAGQAIMEGLLGMKINIWLRRFITRFINVILTTIAILLGLDPLSILVYSQVILSLMIPLPMIPLVILSRDNTLMGELVNRKITTTIAMVFVGIILTFNSYLLINIK